ncbi:MAG: hypothetical protein WA899_01270, partial [Candidatus Sulfotelmatobacter sp.]
TRLDVTGWVWIFPLVLEGASSPVELDFAVDFPPGDLAFAVLASRGANCSKGFLFRRDGT